jgi:hypothetical protein
MQNLNTLIRPTINSPADIKAPVLPADTQPSASPDLTASAMRTIELLSHYLLSMVKDLSF